MLPGFVTIVTVRPSSVMNVYQNSPLIKSDLVEKGAKLTEKSRKKSKENRIYRAEVSLLLRGQGTAGNDKLNFKE